MKNEKITLSEDLRPAFIAYFIGRMNRNIQGGRDLNYLTLEMAEGVFDFFLDHRLTGESDSKTYWYDGRNKEMECYGYSGYSVGTIDDAEQIIENLFHDIWCKAEWFARGRIESYEHVTKNYFGNSWYSKLLEKC